MGNESLKKSYIYQFKTYNMSSFVWRKGKYIYRKQPYNLLLKTVLELSQIENAPEKLKDINKEHIKALEEKLKQKNNPKYH